MFFILKILSSSLKKKKQLSLLFKTIDNLLKRKKKLISVKMRFALIKLL